MPIGKLSYENRVMDGKRRMRVLVHVADETMIGTIDLHEKNELIEELNDGRSPFLELTDVRVYDQAALRVLYTTEAMLLNKGHIRSLAPVNDLSASGQLGAWLASIRMAAADTEAWLEEEEEYAMVNVR